MKSDMNIVLISAATVLLATTISSATTCSAFVPTLRHARSSERSSNTQFTNSEFTIRRNTNSISDVFSPRQNQLSETKLNASRPRRVSWSKRAVSASTSNTAVRESRLGVRRRVRSVLEKAKKRTGIRNKSEEYLSRSTGATTTTPTQKFDIPSFVPPELDIVDDIDESDSIETDVTDELNGINGSEEEISSNDITNEENELDGINGQNKIEVSETPLVSPPSPSEPATNGLNGENKIQASKPTEVKPPSPSEPTMPLKTKSTVINIVADAASIGGLGAVVVDDDSGKIGVALDYVAPKKSPSNSTAITADPVTVRKSEQKVYDLSTSSSSSSSTTSAKPSEKKIKTKPASTYSPPVIQPKPLPEDSLVSATMKGRKSRTLTEVDAFKGDVSAAFSVPPPPLPFSLPNLSNEQNRQVKNGERVQFQSDMGREGSGFVVVDVKAPSTVVWECLLDFYSYPTTIPTVRDIQMFTNTHLAQDYYSEEAVERIKYEDGTLATLKHGVPSVTRAAFTLSKFRLNIAAIHKYRPHPQGDYMIFTLDPACTNVVLKNAKGVWHTQSNPDGRGEEYTRVWLLCDLSVSSLLPKWIVDYAAKRAMPRASSWVKPHVEAAAELWYKELRDEENRKNTR